MPTTPDLADDPTVFPRLSGQSFIAKKSPQWRTAIAEATSGRERRQQRWSYPRWAFNVQYDVLRDASPLELQRLWAFFCNHAGSYAQFSFYDPYDNTVTSQTVATGDGTTRSFQLVRTVGTGNMSFVEPVRSVNGVPTVTVAGSTTSVTVSAGGIITFAVAPANGAAIVWTGSFMFLCRFENDSLDAQQMMQGLWSNSGVSFISVKV